MVLQHASLAATSLCTAKAIREYFREGKLPEPGTICEILFQMFGDWGACRAHEGDVHAEQAVWRVQNVRGRKAPRARVGLTLTDSPHDPVSKPKPHGTGGCPGSPDKLYSDKPGWQGPEIFGWGLELRRSLLLWLGATLSSWRGARLARILPRTCAP